MKKSYEIKTDAFGVDYLEMIDTDGTIRFVPMDKANSDYQSYLNTDKVEHLTEIIPSEAKIK